MRVPKKPLLGPITRLQRSEGSIFDLELGARFWLLRANRIAYPSFLPVFKQEVGVRVAFHPLCPSETGPFPGQDSNMNSMKSASALQIL